MAASSPVAAKAASAWTETDRAERPIAFDHDLTTQEVTKALIKYVIYRHAHFDHIAGGKPFKDIWVRHSGRIK
jgi:glyoxylase-like metal-dependent hydrolase (beta-lactamase superfamily II)